ncbi:MAG: Gfo/Idh/MocA family oxidoreductase [Gemmatimonadetes bacterium]|jgi:myo-inositol 2-dehydrogenase / D-chiro-inositol 1-dehydrogenase|nr:Gfo/Idh/MocA family oxidoreductase [Gemmatimonadota bacterium]
MAATEASIRVGVFGSGGWARRTHIPNLQKLDVDIVALCDVSPEAAKQAADEFGIPASYADGYDMIDTEPLDVLYSCVPAYARTGVEAAAARNGIHLFSEKPQSTSMVVARQISAAVNAGGVLSTVCFRERYRPLFQEAKRRLADKTVVHARFQSFGGLAASRDQGWRGRTGWSHWMAKAGGSAFDWGVHAVDYLRFMTGLDVATAQAFYHDPQAYLKPLSSSFNLVFSTGATASLVFVSSGPSPTSEPWFTIFYEGGYLAIFGYQRIEENGTVVYEADEFDPWFEQDRIFIDAVRKSDGSDLLNDYADGLKSLAPVLAGWSSSARGGQPVDVPSFGAS